MNSSDAPKHAQPGQILAGKYRVERILGRGGMGLVVEANHITLHERVALKFLLKEYTENSEATARFLREARAAVKIKSEHVARVSDVGTLDDGAPYLVMEFLEGKDLAGVLESQGVFAVQDAVDYIIQGCDALAEAHSYGIIHRDVKPANFFLTKRPNGMPLVKVLDFGIAKAGGNDVDNLTKTTAAMGSALYMSPEQMQQTRAVDLRTDIYALGVSLYELLAGKQPYYAETLPQLCAEILTGTPTPLRMLRGDVPDDLALVLERAYARDRGHRYQSIGEFVIALAPYAPARSQAVLENIARLAGLEAPTAGAPPKHAPAAGRTASSPSWAANAPSSPSWAANAPVQAVSSAAGSSPGWGSSPAWSPPAGQANAQSSPGWRPGDPSQPAFDPRASSPTSQPAGTQILSSSQPAFDRAAPSAANPQPAAYREPTPFPQPGIPHHTASSLVTTGPLVQPSSSRTGLIVLAVLGTLGLAGGVGAFVMTRGGSSSASGATTAPSATATATVTSTPPPTTAPSVTVAPLATLTPIAPGPPTASASATVEVPIVKPHTTGIPKGSQQQHPGPHPPVVTAPTNPEKPDKVGF